MPLSRCFVTMNCAKHTWTSLSLQPAWNSPGSPKGWSQSQDQYLHRLQCGEGQPWKLPWNRSYELATIGSDLDIFPEGVLGFSSNQDSQVSLIRWYMSQTACLAPPWGQGTSILQLCLQRECVHLRLLGLEQGRCLVSPRSSSHNLASPYTCSVPGPWIPWSMGLVQVQYVPISWPWAAWPSRPVELLLVPTACTSPPA